MKKFFIALTLSALFLTALFAGPTMAADTTNDVDMTVVMATSEFDEDGSIYVLVNLENNDTEDFTITFNSSCYFSIELTTLADNSGDYDVIRTQNEACDGGNYTIDLPADGDDYVFASYLWYNDLEPGEYRLAIEVAEGKVVGERTGSTTYLEDYETNITVTGGVELLLDTDHNGYGHDEVINATMTINNESAADFSYTSECYPPYRILDEENDVVYDSSDDDTKCGGKRTTTVDAFEEYELEFEVYDPEEWGALDEGDYVLEVDLDNGYTTIALFEVDPPPVAMVELSMDVDDIHYRTSDTITIDWEVTNEGNGYYENSDLGGCSPYLELYDADTELLIYSEVDDPDFECDGPNLGLNLGPDVTYEGTRTFDLEAHKDMLLPGDYYLYLQLFDGNDAPDATSDVFEIFTNEIPYPTPFEDASGHWSEWYLMDLREDGIVEGYPDHSFRPDRAITRAEFLVLILRAFDLHIDDLELHAGRTFTDVDPNDWFYEAVTIAYNGNIINGYDDGTFKPNETISRAEAMSVLLRTLDRVNESYTRSLFSDVTIHWQIPYVMSAYNLGIVNGHRNEYGNLTGKFRPNDKLTRGEACKVLYLARGV